MRPARAFTLLELVVVIAIMALLAGAVIPALSGMDEARGAAAAQEVQRRLAGARLHAIAIGEATGLSIAVSTGGLSMMTKRPGGVAQPARDALGQPVEQWFLPSAFPGVRVSSLVHGDASTGDGTIWFSFEGEPQVRDSDGVLSGSFTQDAVVTLSNGATVTVRRLSGLVE